MIHRDKNCITRCQREQVNKFLQHFFNAKRRVNNFRIFLFCNFTRGVGNWKRAQILKGFRWKNESNEQNLNYNISVE